MLQRKQNLYKIEYVREQESFKSAEKHLLQKERIFAVAHGMHAVGPSENLEKIEQLLVNDTVDKWTKFQV